MKTATPLPTRSLLITVGTVLLFFLSSAGAQENPRPYFDPDRFEEAITAFEQAHAAEPEPEGAVLAIGSSSIRFWRTIKDDLAPLTIVHRGFGGSTMRDALHYMDRIVIPHKPRAVVLYEGDNDLAAFKVAPAVVMENFNAFAAKLQETLPDTRLYVLSIKPSIARMDTWDAMAQTNGRLQARCAEIDGCTYIDVATPMFHRDGELREDIFVEDNIHMNAAGYDIWTQTVKPVLLERELAFESE